ncbi:MAG: hypothetical protein LBU31_03305, partial [Coriobacteriales bacterium]|nr:hypothetical protein [Coriobacteriales bacterium]
MLSVILAFNLALMLAMPFGIYADDVVIGGGDNYATQYGEPETTPSPSTSGDPAAAGGSVGADNSAPAADPATSANTSANAGANAGAPFDAALLGAILLGASPLGAGAGIGGGFTPYAAPAAGSFDINKPLGGGTVTSDSTAIHIYGEGIEQIFPAADNDAARTAALVSAVGWLVTNGGGKDYVMYIPPRGATSETPWPLTTAINFAGLTSVRTLVITGVAADPVVGASGKPEPATVNTQAGYTRLTGSINISFGCNVILRNIRYQASNIYMNGHDLTLGHKSWSGSPMSYYGGAASGTISGNPSMTVWSTGYDGGKTTFVGGNYRGTLNGNVSLTINNTSGNPIEVWGAGYGDSASNTANLNGNATTTINGMSKDVGGLGYFVGGVQYGNVTGTIKNTIKGQGRFRSTGLHNSYTWDTNYGLILGGSRKGDIGKPEYRPNEDSTQYKKPVSGTGTDVITNNIDTSAWTSGRAHFVGANYTGGTVQGNIVNTVKTGTRDMVGSITSYSGGAGRNAFTAANNESETSNWLSAWSVTANDRSLTVGNVDGAITAAKNAMRFKLYGNITNTIRSGVIHGDDWDAGYDRHMRGAGYGFVWGNTVTHAGTEGPVGRTNAFSRPAYTNARSDYGQASNMEFSGGGGQPFQMHSIMIVGDTKLYLDNVYGDWVYGGSYAGCQIGDTLAVLNDGIVDTLEGAGRDYYVHIGDSRVEVRGGQVDWFLSGVGYDDRYSVGDTSVEIYEAPKIGNQVMPVINASVAGMFGQGADRNYISGDSMLTIHGGDFSGTANGDPRQGLSAGPSNAGRIFGNATTTIDVRGNTQGFKVESRDAGYPNRVSGGLRYGAGNNTFLGASSANTITLNVFADKTTGSLLKGMNLYGDGAADIYAGNTRSGKITMNINAPGADIGELYATRYPNITSSSSQMRRDVTINLVSAKSVEGITSCGPYDDITQANANSSLAANKQAVLNVGPQSKPANWDDRPVASGGQGDWPLHEYETVPATDGFPPRINVTKNGVTNFTSMTIADRLLIAQTGSILNSGKATPANHGGSYNAFGDVTVKDGAGLGVEGSGKFIAGKLTVEGLGYVASPGAAEQVVLSDVELANSTSRLQWLKSGSVGEQGLGATSTWFGLTQGWRVITLNSTVGGNAAAGKANANKFTPVNLTGQDMVTGKTYIGDSALPSGNNGFGVCVAGSFYEWEVMPGPDSISSGTVSWKSLGTLNVGDLNTRTMPGKPLDVFGTSAMDTPSSYGSIAIPSAKVPNPVGYPTFTFAPNASRGEWIYDLDVRRSDQYVANPKNAYNYHEFEQSRADYLNPLVSNTHTFQTAASGRPTGTYDPANPTAHGALPSGQDDKAFSFDIKVDYTNVVELEGNNVIIKESDALALFGAAVDAATPGTRFTNLKTLTGATGRPFFRVDGSETAEPTSKLNQLGTPLGTTLYRQVSFALAAGDVAPNVKSKTISVTVVPDDAVIDHGVALVARSNDIRLSQARVINGQAGVDPTASAGDSTKIDYFTGAVVIDTNVIPAQISNASLTDASSHISALNSVTTPGLVETLPYYYDGTYLDNSGAPQSFRLDKDVTLTVISGNKPFVLFDDKYDPDTNKIALVDR